MFFWAVAGGYFTFSCQLGISIPQSWIYLFFLPFSLSNVICKSNFSYHLNASASQMFPLYSSRFMSSLDYLFACLHTTGNLSSIWPELAPIKLALISLFLTPFFFLSHHEWYHCYPKHISCDSSSVWSSSWVNSSTASGPWHVLLNKTYKLWSSVSIYKQHLFRLSSRHISIAANPSLLTVTNTILPYSKHHRNIHFAELLHWAHHSSFYVPSLVHL